MKKTTRLVRANRILSDLIVSCSMRKYEFANKKYERKTFWVFMYTYMEKLLCSVQIDFPLSSQSSVLYHIFYCFKSVLVRNSVFMSKEGVVIIWNIFVAVCQNTQTNEWTAYYRGLIVSHCGGLVFYKELVPPFTYTEERRMHVWSNSTPKIVILFYNKTKNGEVKEICARNQSIVCFGIVCPFSFLIYVYCIIYPNLIHLNFIH